MLKMANLKLGFNLFVIPFNLHFYILLMMSGYITLHFTWEIIYII